MPYRNPEDRRRYDRERRERLRAAGSLRLARPVRIQVAADVEALLAEAVALIRSDRSTKGTERARALGYLASVAIRLIEARELEARLEAVEGVTFDTAWDHRVRRLPTSLMR
jgi:hypothetical protein